MMEPILFRRTLRIVQCYQQLQVMFAHGKSPILEKLLAHFEAAAVAADRGLAGA